MNLRLLGLYVVAFICPPLALLIARGQCDTYLLLVCYWRLQLLTLLPLLAMQCLSQGWTLRTSLIFFPRIYS